MGRELDIKDFRFEGKGKFCLGDHKTSLGLPDGDRPLYERLTTKNTLRMGDLQDRLYAQRREGLVVLLQAMDAAGKDSAIKHVMSGVNPQGVVVHSFKQPSSLELSHDYLWRAACNLPARGMIGLFNRSYYEDVLVVRVHGLWKDYDLPDRCLKDSEKDFFARRFRQIRDFEEYLYENGYRVLKIFLNVGLDEQKKRFLARIEDPKKNWKFSSGDLTERALWPRYMRAYEEAIDATATGHAPWYVLPADQKWLARWMISQALVETLRDMDPHYPSMLKSERERLADCRQSLLDE